MMRVSVIWASLGFEVLVLATFVLHAPDVAIATGMGLDPTPGRRAMEGDVAEGDVGQPFTTEAPN